MISHLFDVCDDDGNDKVGDGDGDEEDKGDKEQLDQSIAAAHTPHWVESKVVVEVVLARHHVDHLEEGGEGVVEHVVLPHGQMEGEGKGQQDRREHYAPVARSVNV